MACCTRQEMACFGEAGEIGDLVSYYLRHPEVREKMEENRGKKDD